MKRALSGIGIALLLLPIVSFEVLYRSGLYEVELTLPAPAPTPALMQDALWIAHGETPDAGVARLWAWNYFRLERPRGVHAAGQLARRMTPEHTGMLAWHLHTGAITVWLSRHMSEAELKQQLPENTWFGRGASGAGAAAWVFFHKRVQELTPAEIATLAASAEQPSAKPERLKRHRDAILTKLHDAGRLTDDALRDALATP